MSAEIPFISSGGGPHDPFAGFGGPTPNASFPGGPPPPPHAAMPASDAASLFGGFNGSPISPALPAGRGAFGGGLAASEAPADLFGPAAGALDDPLGLNAANASAAGQFGQATQAGGGLTYEEASRNWTLDQATNMFYDSAQGLYFSADETGYSWHAYTWHEGNWAYAGITVHAQSAPAVASSVPVSESALLQPSQSLLNSGAIGAAFEPQGDWDQLDLDLGTPTPSLPGPTPKLAGDENAIDVMDAFATDGQNGVVDVFGTPAQPTEQTVSHAETGPRRDSKADVSSRAPSSAGTSKMEHHRSTDGPRDVRPPSVAERPPSVVERPPSVNVRRPSETSTPLRPSSSAQPSPSASSEASEMSPSPVRYRPPSSTKLRPSLASQTPFRSLPNSPQKRPEKNADIFDILLGTSGQVAPSPAQPVSGVQPRSHFLRTLAERQARRAERAGSASSGSMNVSPNKPEAVSEKTVEAKGELASPQQQSSRTERSKASSPISTRPDSSASISAEAAGPTEPEETLAVPVMPITLSVETAPQIAIIEPVAIEGPSSTQNRPPSVQQRRPSLQERPPSSQRSHSVASPLGRVERSPSGLDELVLSRPTMDPTSSTAAGPEGLISVGYGVEPGSIGAAYSDVTFGKLPSESIQPETPAAAFAVPQGGAHDIQGLVFEQQVVEEKAGHTPGFDGWELPPAPPRNALEEEPSAPAMEIIEQPIAPSVAMEGTEHLDNNAVVGTESMAGALDQNFPEGYDPYHGYGGEDTYGYEQGRPAEGFVVSEQVDGQDQYVSHIGEQGYPGYEHYDAGLAPPQTDSGWPSVEHVEVGDGWVAPPTAEETEDAVADLAQTSDETNVVYEPGPEAFGETQPQVSGGDGMEFQHFVEGEGYGLPPSSEQPNYGNGAYADYGPQDEAYIAEDADGFGGDANASFMSSFAAAYIRDDEDGDVIDHGFEENRAPLETSYHESGYESGQQFAENALSQNDFPDHQEYAHDQQFIPAGNTCPNCNKNNDVDANFCSKCGSKLGVSDNAPTISAALVEPVGATVDQGSTSANFPAQSVLPTAPVGAWNQGPVGPNPYAKPAISPARSKTSSPAQGAHPSAAVAAAMAAEHQRFRLSPAISESGRPSLNRPPIAREEHSIKDPLGRTRGHCLAMFGFGGKLLTMVPIKQSRFNAALNATVEKIYPGNVVIRPIRALNLPALEAEFVKIERWRGPILGPKAKPNKKDSVKAVYAIVQALETQLSSFHGNDGEPKALAQERIALWKIIGAAIDNDGLFSGKSGGVTTPAVVNILKELAGSRQSVGGIFGAIEAALLDGDRLRACNIARENGQWAHALVIASFIDRGTYSDVLSAFAKSQFEGGEAAVAETAVTPERIPTLRVLYNLFAGVTGDAAVVDFMPPERTDMPTTEELNEWRYILAIILANRTSGDSAAVTALGDLLRSHSRLHAAQICYAVSLQTSAVSGLDFPNVRTVLFDVDHVGKFGMQRPRFFLSPEAVQLSEAFEVAQILANASNVGQGSLPHLQAYKLAYAWRLAELGFADIAARYCESIEEIVNVYSKGSPYFNRRFLECLKDLDVRIAGMNVMSTVAGAGDAKDGGTWLKRMTKLDGWMTALDKGLNKFMNGAVGMDTTEAAPAADSMVPHVPMAPLHAGVDGSTGGMDSQTFVPFVVSAEVPAMYGQAGFQAEGTMLTGEQLMYYNPDGTQPAEQREQDQYGYYEGDQQGQWQQDGGFDGSGQYQGTYEQDNQYGDGQYGDQTGYDANYNEAQGYGEQGYADQAYGVDQGYGGDDGYGANQTYEGQDYAIQGEYEGYDQQTYGEQSPHGDQGAAEGYGQQSYPTQDSDDLPAVPAETDDYGTEAPWDDLPTVPTDSPISFNPAMMPTVGQSDFSVASAEPPVPAVKPSVPQTHADFDDDLGLGNSKPKSDKPKEEKEESSKDVSKKQEASGGKTWLSGITGLFKRPPGGPVRADLGEENSFYFDKELGRWVNKKAGSAAAAPAPLPPPPMGRPAGLGGNAPGPATGPGIAPPGAVSAGPAPSNPMGSFSAGATGGSSKRRGAANRYVDVLGSGGSVPASRPTASFLPTPGIAAPGATNLLRPMMVPAPAMGSGSGSDHWGSAGADQQDGGDGRS